MSSTLGHGATIRASSFLGSCCQSASVMKGMNGCNSLRHVSNTYTNVRRAPRARSSAPSAPPAANDPIRVLLASIYLSEKQDGAEGREGGGEGGVLMITLGTTTTNSNSRETVALRGLRQHQPAPPPPLSIIFHIGTHTQKKKRGGTHNYACHGARGTSAGGRACFRVPCHSRWTIGLISTQQAPRSFPRDGKIYNIEVLII